MADVRGSCIILTALAIFILTISAINVVSSDSDASELYESGGYEYSLKNGEATIEGINYLEMGFDPTIPEELDGHTVVAIGDVELHNLGPIDDYNLGCVKIPRTIESISPRADIPAEKYIVDRTNPWYISDDYGAIYDRAMQELVLFPPCYDSGTYEMPETVTNIGPYAFYMARFNGNVIEVSLSDNLMRLGEYALVGSKVMGNFENPGMLWYEPTSFQECEFEKLTIPSYISTVESNLYAYCTIDELVIEDGVNIIEAAAFFDASIERVTIPESVYRIGNAAFCSITELKEVTIEGSPAMDGGPFAASYNVETLTLGDKMSREQATHLEFHSLSRSATVTVISSGWANSVLSDIVEDDGIGTYFDFQNTVFTITFETNDGTPINDMRLESGTALELPTPVRDGYEFGGWYSDEGFTHGVSDGYLVDGDMTLYAKWTLITEPDVDEDVDLPSVKPGSDNTMMIIIGVVAAVLILVIALLYVNRRSL